MVSFEFEQEDMGRLGVKAVNTGEVEAISRQWRYCGKEVAILE